MPDSPHLEQGLDVRAGHAARAEKPERAAILARHEGGPDGAVRGDAQVLQGAVVDDGERLARFDVRQKHQAAVATRTRAERLPRAAALGRPPLHDPGFPPDGERTAGATAV